MPNAPRDTQKNYAPNSPKVPSHGALLRNKLAPDVPAAEAFISNPGVGPNDEMCQGSNPSTPGVTVGLQAMSPDDKRTTGHSGPPGP